MIYTTTKAHTFKQVLCLLGCLVQGTLLAQDVGYWQPQIALNYNLSERYSHNSSIENRNYVYRNGTAELSLRQIDLNHFSKWAFGNGKSMSLGVKYRFREAFDGGGNELRFTQQFNSTNQKHVIRFGHRFRSEQRIFRAQTVHRFRYRFAVDFPLEGEKLDLGETYLVITTESVLSLGSQLRPAYDQRVTSQIGWLLKKRARLQLGLEYRLEDYTQSSQRVLFLLSSFIISL